MIYTWLFYEPNQFHKNWYLIIDKVAQRKIIKIY